MQVKDSKWAIEQVQKGHAVSREAWPEFQFVTVEALLTKEEEEKLKQKLLETPGLELDPEYYENLEHENVLVLGTPVYGEDGKILYLGMDRWNLSAEDKEADDYKIFQPELPASEEHLKEQGQE